MTSIGFNSTAPAAGCGGGMAPAAAAMPRPAAYGAGAFALPDFGGMAAPDPFGGERFISSQAGGFVLDKDGELAGRVPEGSYVDTKSGKVYGPDNKPITIPEGGTVDFRDLPDLADILKMVKAAAEGADEIHGDRFITSEGGGVIIGKDGEVAGRVPAGSFVDAKSGKVYGPDSKPITLPEGATVDFFDLPDLDDLLKQVRAGGGTMSTYPAPGKFDSFVNGQWGPGGVTPIKGGAVAPPAEDCGMDHGPATSKAGGPTSLNGQLASGLAQLQRMGVPAGLPHPGMMMPSLPPGAHHVFGGGHGSAVNGARGLGSLPSLDASLKELVLTLRELTDALAKTTAGGKTELKTEPAKTKSTPSTTSSPSSSSSSS